MDIFNGGKISQNQLLGMDIFSISKLISSFNKIDYDRLNVWKPASSLRYYHYQRDGQNVYVLFNEDDTHILDLQFSLNSNNKLFLYSAIENKIYNLDKNDFGYNLILAPAESVVLFEKNEIEDNLPIRKVYVEKLVLNHLD